MKLLVIEDEPLIASGLMNDLRILNPHAEIAGPLSSNREIREWFDKNNLPDLIFSDIQLSDGISFDALAEMAQACPIIFITAFDEYALKAFEVNALDYLMKPVEPKRLADAIHDQHGDDRPPAGELQRGDQQGQDQGTGARPRSGGTAAGGKARAEPVQPARRSPLQAAEQKRSKTADQDEDQANQVAQGSED